MEYLNYPTCGQEYEATTEPVATCPKCNCQFTTTAPEIEELPAWTPPSHQPFFKNGRVKLLKQRLDEILAGTEKITEAAEHELNANGIVLGLGTGAGTALLEEEFNKALAPLKQEMEQTMHVTDANMQRIQQLEQRYNVQLTMAGNAQVFRAIYELEAKRLLPPPTPTTLLLKPQELAYTAIPTTWSRLRSQHRRYAGLAVTVPTGIKGLRLNLGQYNASHSIELTHLATGTLYLTNKRLLFVGTPQSPTTNLEKIVNGEINRDALKIDKISRKTDFFTMEPQNARYLMASFRPQRKQRRENGAESCAHKPRANGQSLKHNAQPDQSEDRLWTPSESPK